MNTRLMVIATLSTLALAALPIVVGAQQQQRQRTQPTLKEAVAACVLIVRDETNKRIGVNVSDFDAYTTDEGAVSYFGTPKERFSFEKCMNEMGHPLQVR